MSSCVFETKYCCASVAGLEHTRKHPKPQQSSCLCLHIAGITGRRWQAQLCSFILRPQWYLGWKITGYHHVVLRLPIFLQCSGRSLLAPRLGFLPIRWRLCLLSVSKGTTVGAGERSRVSTGLSLDLPSGGRRSTLSARQYLSLCLC